MITVVFVHGQLSHGGSERQLFQLLRHCDRDRFDPHLVISGELGFWEDPIAELDVPITLLNGSAVQKMLAVRRYCRDVDADVVFSWSGYTNAYTWGAIGSSAKRIGSFRNIRTYGRRAESRFERVRLRAMLRPLDVIIANSSETRDSLTDEIRKGQELIYVPNGVDPLPDAEQKRKEWRDQLGLDDDDLLVIGVGRLAEQKNFVRFVDAVAIAGEQIDRCRGLIVGPDKGGGDEVRERIAELGMGDAITLFGASSEARDLICAADVYLLSSDYEGMPNVVMEAMSAGVPCVTTPVHGVATLIVDGESGAVSGFAAEELAADLVMLLKDADLRARYGAAGVERMTTHFAPAALAAQVWELCADGERSGTS